MASFNDSTKAAVNRLIDQAPPDVAKQPSALAVAISQALCYINTTRMGDSIEQITPDDVPKLEARILVVTASPDAPHQHTAIMNCFFAAQTQQICIDACVIGCESAMLQQAACLTDSIYYHADTTHDLHVKLLTFFSGDKQERRLLKLPNHMSSVDFTAYCCCHNKAVSQAHACSDCLSVFCDEFKKSKPKGCPCCSGKFTK